MSVSTVSYALNNGPRSVPAEVKERVLKVAQELDYRPNRIARSMVTGKTFTIGIVPTGQFENFIVSPFVLNCMNGIVNSCEQLGYDVLIFTRFDSSQEREIANSMSDGRVDGLIFIAPLVGTGLMEVAERREVPFVVVSGLGDGQHPTMTVDNHKIVGMAIEHFLSHGHKKIAHIYGSLNLEDGWLRKVAFEEILNANGIHCSEEWILPGDFTQTGGQESFEKMFSGDDVPTAVFCSNDEMAYGALAGARNLGLNVPEDVSIIGVDNAPWGGLLTPGLTTIAQPTTQMATSAVNSLLALIEEGTRVKSQQFEPDLVVRGTVSSPKEHKKS